MKQVQQPIHKHICNQAISYEKVFVVNDQNQPIGVMSRKQMLTYASDQGLDAVLISIDPKPIVKMMDYGKYKYQSQKNHKQAKQNQPSHKVHQMMFSVLIGDRDLDVKIVKCMTFLLNFDSVKIQIRQRGRQIQRPELATNLISKIYERVHYLCADFRNQIKTKGHLIEWTLQPVKQKITQWKEQNGS